MQPVNDRRPRSHTRDRRESSGLSALEARTGRAATAGPPTTPHRAASATSRFDLVLGREHTHRCCRRRRRVAPHRAPTPSRRTGAHGTRLTRSCRASINHVHPRSLSTDVSRDPPESPSTSHRGWTAPPDTSAPRCCRPAGFGSNLRCVVQRRPFTRLWLDSITESASAMTELTICAAGSCCVTMPAAGPAYAGVGSRPSA